MKTCLVAVCSLPSTHEGVLRTIRTGYSLSVQYCDAHAWEQGRTIRKQPGLELDLTERTTA